jgi:hypothetical protein
MTSNYTGSVLGLGAMGLAKAARLATMEIATTTGLLSTTVSSRAGIAPTASIPSILAGDVRV